MKYGIVKAGFKGLDLDFADYTEVAATMVALRVLKEFGRMVEALMKELEGEVVTPEDAEVIAERNAEDIETAVRLYLNKRPDLVESSFEFNERTTVEDGHANGGLLRAVLRVIVKGEAEAPWRHEFEVMFDISDRSLTLTLIADPRNGEAEDRPLPPDIARRVKRNLESIVVRCEEGDPRSDWLPIINRLAKEARDLLPE